MNFYTGATVALIVYIIASLIMCTLTIVALVFIGAYQVKGARKIAEDIAKKIKINVDRKE